MFSVRLHLDRHDPSSQDEVMGERKRWLLIWEIKLSSSGTAVKVGSRATFHCEAVNVLVYEHTHLCTASYEDSPA